MLLSRSPLRSRCKLPAPGVQHSYLKNTYNFAKGLFSPSKFLFMQAWKDYQANNKDRFLDELLELLRIPSVSARSEHKEDMVRCAEKVKQRLLEAGADTVEIMPTAGHPAVFAQKIV